MNAPCIIRTDLHDYAERIVAGTANLGLISAREREEWREAAQYLLDTGDAEELQYLIDLDEAIDRHRDFCGRRGIETDFDEGFWLPQVTASESTVPGRVL